MSNDCKCEAYREIFNEITLKAKPLCEDASDPERITAYRIPVGPIHRACGKVNHHMLGVEEAVNAAVESVRGLEFLRKWKLSDEARRDIEEIEHNARTAVQRINESGWPYCLKRDEQ